MDLLKTIWPTPFKIERKNLSSFLVQLIIFIVVCAVVGILIGVLSAIPILGVIFWILGSLLELYSLVGIVLCVLVFLDVIK
ncbi:MAG: hypothetical protein E7612_03770 [Ruminococcaceae bacterium]|nr:hypothetical protein [Oscillospiraceae bacterium]